MPYPPTFPHCDSRVLHAPEDNCKFCNESGLQEIREQWKINFTGHYDPNKTTCPAERERPLETINRWGGNVAYTPELELERKEAFKEFQLEMEKVVEELTDKRKRDYWGK
jgi:hypothetical protein